MPSYRSKSASYPKRTGYRKSRFGRRTANSRNDPFKLLSMPPNNTVRAKVENATQLYFRRNGSGFWCQPMSIPGVTDEGISEGIYLSGCNVELLYTGPMQGDIIITACIFSSPFDVKSASTTSLVEAIGLPWTPNTQPRDYISHRFLDDQTVRHSHKVFYHATPENSVATRGHYAKRIKRSNHYFTIKKSLDSLGPSRQLYLGLLVHGVPSESDVVDLMQVESSSSASGAGAAGTLSIKVTTHGRHKAS